MAPSWRTRCCVLTLGKWWEATIHLNPGQLFVPLNFLENYTFSENLRKFHKNSKLSKMCSVPMCQPKTKGQATAGYEKNLDSSTCLLVAWRHRNPLYSPARGFNTIHVLHFCVKTCHAGCRISQEYRNSLKHDQMIFTVHSPRTTSKHWSEEHAETTS